MAQITSTKSSYTRRAIRPQAMRIRPMQLQATRIRPMLRGQKKGCRLACIYLIIDKCGWMDEGRIWDGQFIDPSWFSWCAPQDRFARWADGTINATWWCTKCLAEHFGLEIPDTRTQLGVKNPEARRKRTGQGSVWRNPKRLMTHVR